MRRRRQARATAWWQRRQKDQYGTEVIHTTSSHLFYDPSLNKFLPVSNLKPGTHLKTPDGQAAVVVGGSTPAVHDGWMWDLTVQDDHDFYVEPAVALPPSRAGPTAVLVHNCTINPNTVRFSQKGVSPIFKKGNSLADTVAALRNGDISASDFPSIRLVERDGNLYTLDNRRLVAFQQAGLAEVPYVMATPEEIAAESWKFDPGTDGTSIKIRGGGGIWSPINPGTP